MADDSERMKRKTLKQKKMGLLLCSWLGLFVGYCLGAIITHTRIEIIVRRKVREIFKQEEEQK
jgi:hypothetical protein